MATCKNCFHYEACSGFKPTDLDKDVWHYCQMGIPEEIPDIDQRCDSFKDRKSWVEVVRCKDCVNGIYDEENDIYKCVKSAEMDSEFGDWIGFVSYHNADYYCAGGERKDND